MILSEHNFLEWNVDKLGRSTENSSSFSLRPDEKMNRKSVRSKENTKKHSSNTKKNPKKYLSDEKKKIWEMFDNDCISMQDKLPPNTITGNFPTNSFSCSPENSSSFSLRSDAKINICENHEGIMCKICSSILIITEDGFPTCTSPNCGVIHRDTLDYSPEWRYYGGDDKNSNDTTRCGNPINPLLIESSFGCKIICNSHSSYEMKKIRKWTEWQSMPHKEKSLYEEFQFITTMAQNSGIPKILIDDAMSIHKDISEQKMFRGLNRDGIKAASIYISCRLNGCPRTAHEISEIFYLDKISATAGCSTAVNILHNIERNLDPSLQTNLGLTTPSSFIDRYCSKLNMNKESTVLAKFVVLKVEKNSIITDNTPHAIAAGVVYFVAKNCNISINKIDIKKVCGISEVTVNKCYKKLEAVKTQLLPNCFLQSP
jgi:transcription initiation factor TFIIB